ncbi:hypothetical protein G6M89_00060 [Natronolimnobius sp. AArcel1]|uniref:hypothetical protein n=1 Tax=Natronolimnobius sp. AArcel1 TaxID=1679093 RepID=UPI0013EE060B|nr:hypothetical protein [Natronolimnobius sp. AArcel1]NGM67412.1 hypothetical protein [Natronolimnobius sp. AArcel1]
MIRPYFLLLAVGVTVIGVLIVGWLGVLAVRASSWLPNAVGYLIAAIVCITLLVLFWKREQRGEAV